jgi:phosphotransferase family enzyme
LAKPSVSFRIPIRPSSATIERVETRLAGKTVEWRRIGRGYTVAERWIAVLEGGESVFVKKATDEDTDVWLRAEHRSYEVLEEEFLPRLIAWDDGHDPILILEDLSGGFWPPPWSKDHIERVIEVLDRLANTKAPNHFPSLAADRSVFSGWQALAKDPSGFLELGLASAEWLERALPVLARAEAAAELAGDALVHGDPRSDNICFHGNRTLLVDWNGAARGNPRFDLLAWLPSLHAEGGPPPWAFTIKEPELIAAIAGYFAFRAWQPPHKQGPAIRQLQLTQLRSALPWAAIALGLDHPPSSGSGT